MGGVPSLLPHCPGGPACCDAAPVSLGTPGQARNRIIHRYDSGDADNKQPWEKVVQRI